MIESHFGFSAPPFQLSPDPRFFFQSQGHARALGYLKYGVYQREGFIVVTGAIGSGKTTLVRTLLEGVDGRELAAAQVVSTQLDSQGLLQAICTAFGVPTTPGGTSSKADMLGLLEAFFTALAAAGRRALLIVDEAQNLGRRELEELRMLSNYQLGPQALLQSFLVGQPELRETLAAADMEQLRQRVLASCHLGPLQPAETRAYIEHRLRCAGWRDTPQIEDAAFTEIHHMAGGIPRRINSLCSRLLLASCLASITTIDAAQVRLTGEELLQETGV